MNTETISANDSYDLSNLLPTGMEYDKLFSVFNKLLKTESIGDTEYIVDCKIGSEFDGVLHTMNESMRRGVSKYNSTNSKYQVNMIMVKRTPSYTNVSDITLPRPAAAVNR